MKYIHSRHVFSSISSTATFVVLKVPSNNFEATPGFFFKSHLTLISELIMRAENKMLINSNLLTLCQNFLKLMKHVYQKFFNFPANLHKLFLSYLGIELKKQHSQVKIFSKFIELFAEFISTVNGSCYSIFLLVSTGMSL